MSLPSMQKANLDVIPLDTHGKISKQTAELHGVAVTKVTFNPGARWSTDLRDYAGTSSCELPHVALVLSGTLAVRMDDGSEERFSKDDIMMLPPGHDAWCEGDQPAVFVEFSRGGEYYDDQKRMRSLRTVSVVGCHAEGEVGDVIVGGVLDAPGCKTMYEKMMYFWTKKDSLRQMLLNEPRGRSSMCCNLVLPPCDPRADAGFIIMESDEYAPMSGSNTICTATVLLETGMITMQEPITKFNLDTAAGLVGITAECEAGKCKSVEFDNVACFVFALNEAIDVPGLGEISVDIAWGGMMYALVDPASCGLKIANSDAAKLVEIGERIKRAVQRQFVPVHPENPEIHGVTNFVWSGPLEVGADGVKSAINTVVVSPGRFDRCPCGTGTCARMAVLHARGQLKVGETFKHKSITGSEFINHIRGTTKVGEYDAILPTIKGRGWITSFKQVVLDPTDPFPEGFRVGDQWHMPVDP